MKWNDHSKDIPEGSHAFLSPSSYSWIRYDFEKVTKSYLNHLMTIRGTKLHKFAKECIEMREPLPDVKRTLNMYVNDAIEFRMKPEQPLKYSPICYGTADAIRFDEFELSLRIHDLKTGNTPASMDQLLIYAALFCLEYGFYPKDLNFIELRIYQHNKIVTKNPTTADIMPLMDRIVMLDQHLMKVRKEIENE